MVRTLSNLEELLTMADGRGWECRPVFNMPADVSIRVFRVSGPMKPRCLPEGLRVNRRGFALVVDFFFFSFRLQRLQKLTGSRGSGRLRASECTSSGPVSVLGLLFFVVSEMVATTLHLPHHLK